MIDEQIMIRWFSELSYADKLSLYEGKGKLGVETEEDEDRDYKEFGKHDMKPKHIKEVQKK